MFYVGNLPKSLLGPAKTLRPVIGTLASPFSASRLGFTA